MTQIRAGEVMKICALVAGFFSALIVFWMARSLFLTLFLGLLFGLVLSAAVDWVERWRIRRGIALMLVLLVFFAAMTGLYFWIAPSIGSQLSEIGRELPRAVDKLESWINRRGEVVGEVVLGGTDAQEPRAASDGSSTAPQSDSQAADNRPVEGDPQPEGGVEPSEAGSLSGKLRERFSGEMSGLIRYVAPFLSSTIAVIGGTLLLFFTAVFFAASPETYRNGTLHLVPHRHRERAEEVLDALGTMLRRWMGAQLVSMAVIGALTAIVLSFLDIRAAIALGFIAGLSEFIPVFGPLLSAIPALGIAFLESPQKALHVLIAYVAIQQVESNIVTPLVMKRGVHIPPIITIMAGSVMAILFGFLGLMVAVPLVACVMVLVKMLYVNDVVGDDVKVIGENETNDE